MVDLYSKPSISGYNSSPPSDDDSQTSANAVSWAKHINKIGGPLKTYIDAVNDAVDGLADDLFGNAVTALSSNYSLTTADYGKTLKASNAITLTLLTGSGAGGNFVFSFYNSDSSNNLTIGRNGVNINGAASNLTIYPKQAGIAFSDGTDWWIMVIPTPDSTSTISGNWIHSGTLPMSGTWHAGLVTSICDGRLTLTTATPVTTADVTAATTIYLTPYKGNKISLYDGSSLWKVYSFTELSIAVPATTDTMYDVFVYDNAGTPTLELTAWTNDTTRATALTTQNGVLVKTGATTRHYVGSFRTTGVSGQTEDSDTKRYVWNYYNRVTRRLRVIESTNSWTYSTAAFRQANAAAGNQVDVVIGYAEDVLDVVAVGFATNSLTTTRSVTSGIGVGSTTVNSAITSPAGAASTSFGGTIAVYKAVPAVGRQYYSWLERGDGADTQTWYGDNGGTELQAGIHGSVLG